MELDIDYAAITELFQLAQSERRNFLYEHEVYQLLSYSGAETPPRTQFIPRGSKPSDEEIFSIAGEKTVLKIVSPTIIHKTEVGGVTIIPKTPDKVRSSIRRMMYDVPERYTDWIEHHASMAPSSYQGLSGQALKTAITRDLKGVLQVQFMPPDSNSFGNELIVGLRRSREFGMILSAGIGGTDTELYGEAFKKGQAIVAGSTVMLDGEAFFDIYRNTISYNKLAGLTRGQRRVVSDEQLIECFQSFVDMANYFSEQNPDAPFYIEELEINPFAFTDYLMVPLDGMCRFSLPYAKPPSRPIHKINNLLHPELIGIIGVSATRKNFGRVILDNILKSGYSPNQLVIIKEDAKEIDGVRCIPNLAALEKPMDLFVVAIGAEQVPPLVDEIIARKCAHSVMLIPGGIGETEDSHDLAEAMINNMKKAHRTKDGGPVFLGANSMGVVSRPGGYDTWFIPEDKLPKTEVKQYHRAAIVSQSGAFMLNRISQCPELCPAYMISMGNQTDLTLGDMLHYFKNSTQVDIIAVYAEGFNDNDGLQFVQAVREAVLAGKQVVFYKAGRTPEGKSAASGHTASLAGDYMVCESCVREAGAIVVRNFTEFQDVLFLAETLHNKEVCGKRLGAISGAGCESVGMADSLHSIEYSMGLGTFTEQTRTALSALIQRKKLTKLVAVQNPMDINPAADDEMHVETARLLMEDPNIDAVVLGVDPLSPVTSSLEHPTNPQYRTFDDPEGLVQRVITLSKQTYKPLIIVADGGRMYDPLRDTLRNNGIPVFNLCDRAVAALSLYIESRLAAQSIRELGVSTCASRNMQ